MSNLTYLRQARERHLPDSRMVTSSMFWFTRSVVLPARKECELKSAGSRPRAATAVLIRALTQVAETGVASGCRKRFPGAGPLVLR